jgi:nitroreductase
MEFADVLRRRHMVRRFADREVPGDAVDRILGAALRAPSAGFAQGLELVLLDRKEQIARFWEVTDPWARKGGEGGPPVLVIPFANKMRYLERYSAPDKQGLGMDEEEGWPVPYWDLDAAMAAMLMLLAAVEEGLGGWLFGIFHGEDELLRWLKAPSGVRPIGALGFGYAHPDEERRGSATARARRSFEEVVHRGGFAK